MDGHELKSSLLADAAECQRRNGVLPDTRADEAFWQEQLEELDRRKAELKQRVAEGYEDALNTLERAGYDEINFFLERQRQTVPIAEARASLR